MDEQPKVIYDDENFSRLTSLLHSLFGSNNIKSSVVLEVLLCQDLILSLTYLRPFLNINHSFL